MKHFRKNDGFTLVELMVSILVGTIITGAAVTVLLLGLRINKSSTDTASRQNTTRILLSVLENLAEEGKITNVETTLESWKVVGTDGKVLMSYTSRKRAIYTGEAPTGENEKGNPLLENVVSSYLELNEIGLLKFSVETVDGIFNSSVYCRTAVSISGESGLPDNNENKDNLPDNDVVTNVDDSAARGDFVSTLLSQYQKANNGLVPIINPGIIFSNGESTGVHYTKWYVGGTYSDGWNENTPWCAAYVSWCLNQVSDKVASPVNRKRKVTNNYEYYWYANVDDFMAYIQNNSDGHTWTVQADATASNIQPGDLVFFDWIVNAEENPQHMGVVLSVGKMEGEDCIYTIEGNTAGQVALRQYRLSDNRILGYGVLNWN